uniref:Beta-1,4-galactosyltransferase n=1 Tax=Acanthochromis polyacanthus TaxID=80966 RepID=A0A3Q1GR56_9TELE
KGKNRKGRSKDKNFPFYLFLFIFPHLFIYFSLCFHIYLFIYFSLYFHIYLFNYLFLFLFPHLFIYLFIYILALLLLHSLVAIIIPFRNRHEHLKHWLYFLHPMLMRQQLDYGVYVINQDGVGVFNRAKLMNVGYVEALKQYDYDCFVFSDVDLVPLDDRNIYKCFDNPRHLSVAIDKHNFHLPYRTYYGGVSSLFKDQFLKINGFPNNYWGWGGEDDDIYKRIVFRGMSISRPDSKIGRYKMIKHRRDLHNEANPKNHGILRRTKSTMDVDGINSLNYTVKEIVKDALYTFITVDIQAPANYKNI